MIGKRLVVFLSGVFLFCMAGTVLAAEGADSSSNNDSIELKAELQDIRLRVKALEAALAAKQDELDKKNKNKSELTNLDVRVNNLEKKSEKNDKLSDTLSISGFLHLSDQYWNNSGDFKHITAKTGETPHTNDGHYPAVGIDLYINYKVNDKWQIKSEDEVVRDLRSGGYWSNGADGSVAASQHADQLYAEGIVGATTLKAGRFDYGAAYGLIVAPGRSKGIDGVQFAFGNKIKTILTYGYYGQAWSGIAINSNIISSATDNRYAALEFDTPLSQDSNFKVAFHNIRNDGSDLTVMLHNINLWEVGADKLIAKDLQLFATCGQSNASTQNKAYAAGLTYKQVDIKTPGSYSITASYLKAEAKSSIMPPASNYWVSKYDWGLEGPELSAVAMFAKNLGMNVWASSLKATDGIHNGKINTVKAQFSLYF
ncbi:hypothetical protein Ga0466249_004480 [Sporomusaceae bacterium BoRhaA]|uniref:hypothetical protein n=1 Tax=Pelorhabdus rhamnosifermentans TaxID=2772457 RepID=UPI001C06189A|nr:hypothetical protein [Pelorhabdus rhamnosifermentans]MBU2703335.1 hypothetical protein [Pelorhabdus rhamnosifermentans]